MVRVVARADSRVVIQWHNRARWRGRVVQSIGSGDGARVTEMIEVNKMDGRVSIAEGVGSGGRGRNAGQ